MFPPFDQKILYNRKKRKENKRSDFTQSSVRDWD